MLANLTLSRQTSRRRASAKTRVTFNTFTSSIRPQQKGERAKALHADSRPSKKLDSSRVKGFAFGIVALVIMSIATVVLLTSFEEQPKEPVSPRSASEQSDPGCSFSFTDTKVESRTKSTFGGVRVETGELDCDGEAFSITQTSNVDGDVLSVKKKRA